MPTVTSPTTSDALNFGAGVIGLATGTVNVTGTQSAEPLTFASGSGTIMLSGGTAINLAAASTLTLNNATDTISMPLTGAGTGANITSVIKTGAGTWQLAGTNSYTGNTTINSGGTLTLTVAGSLKFVPTANDVCNKITGAGTANLNGTFNIDLTNAAIANGNSWTLVDVTTKTYGGTFAVSGFSNSSGVWTKVDGNNTWTFTQSTGVLSLEAKYTVTYNNNGGTGSQDDGSNPYNPGATVTVLGVGSMAKTDCTFGGWNTQSDRSGTSYNPGDTFSIAGNVMLYAKWTTASSPGITTSGTLSAVNSTYGTASASPTSFTVSGTDMIAGIMVTPPAGFEVTKTVGGASGYAGSGNAITVGAAGTIAETTVYVRLTALATVGFSPYSGNVTCTSSGATQKDVATVSSTVSPATLTLTANDQSKPYGITQTTPVTNSMAFTPTGLKNSETVGTVTLTYGAGGLLTTDAVGATSTITPSAATGGTFTPGNYTVEYVAGTLTVVKATPTATLAVNNSPVTWDGSAHAALVGITTSSVPGTVQNILTGGAVSQTAAGTYAVTANFVPNDAASYNTFTNMPAGSFTINTAPASTGGSVTMRLNTANTFVASNFQFSDADGGTFGAIKVVTSLPTHGTLKLNGVDITVVPSAAIPVANIPTLTYTPALTYTGTDSFKFQVSDGMTYSADATIAITITSAIVVPNGSFETRGVINNATYWWSLGSPWTAGITNGYEVLDMRGWEGATFTNAADGFYAANMATGIVFIAQNLLTSVNEGDTLSVTFSGGRPKGGAGGKFTATFVVGTTEYTSSEFDTTLLAQDSWHSYTFTTRISNTGNLSLIFRPVSGSGSQWLDKVSNISLTPAPPRGTVIILW